ncbi:unnamed protein product [Wickerhamomyces anomalus]
MSTPETNKSEASINLKSLSPSPSPSDSIPKANVQQVEEAIPTQSLWDLKTAILLCITTSFSGFIFGWDVGTIGGISNMASFSNCFAPLDATNGTHVFSSIVVGLIISVFNAGCAIGGLTIPKICDSKGRRFGIFISILIYLVGNVIQLTSVLSGSWVQVLIGRIITGLAIGSTSVLTPMFISESSPLKNRGAMVVFYQLMITLGILLGNVVNFASKASYEGLNTEWMIPIALCFVWSFMILVGLVFMPESPVFLISIGDREGAIKSVAKLNNLSVNNALVLRIVADIVDTSNRIKQDIGDVKWNEFLIGKPRLFLRLVIGMIIMFFQQFSGANYFFYYGTTLFNSVGLEDSYVTAIILAAVNFLSTFGGVYFVERFGRKFCLLVGSIGMFTCMVIYSSLGSFALLDQVSGLEKTSVGAVMILFTCVYIFFFATTWGPVSFVVVSELYPVRVRATSMSIATSINWFSNFLISLFTPFITKAIGFKYGYVFVGCLFVSALFVGFFVPETKGLNIDQIDALYSKSDDEEEATN